MRLIGRGHVAIPLMAILAGAVLIMERLNVIQIIPFCDLWPVALIAFGLEDLYVWATVGRDVGVSGKDQ